MKMDPFIEAEEAAGRSVKHCCDMFQVSRAAYYSARSRLPPPGPSLTANWSSRSAKCTTTQTAPTGHRGCTGSCSTGARFAAAGGYAV